MIDKLLNNIERRYPLTEQDTGDFEKLKANGMKFSIRAFRAEGLGWVSVMTASGFFGLMKMDTLIINPTEVDMPLLSYDRVHAMGNDTLIYELYDTMLGQLDLTELDKAKGRTNLLPDHDLGKHWYDDIKLPQSILDLIEEAKNNPELGFDGVEAVVNKLVPPKKAALIELNMKALQLGKEYK